MHRLKVVNQMRGVLIPGPAVTGTVTLLTVGAFGAVKVVSAAKPAAPEPPKDCDPDKPLVRAKDLPIYYDPEKNVLHKAKSCPEEEYPDNSLMYIVKLGRAGVWNAVTEVQKLKIRANTFIETGQSHALSSLEQLRESEDPTPRYAAIGAGTFLGFLFGLRGGFFKKLLYTSTGAAASASLVYPKEAEVYWRDIRELLQEYYSIAYHFTHAAIKDLTGVELSVPEFNKLNPVETIKVWIGKSTDGDNVSKSSPSSASLLPPVTETPSHVVPVTPASTKPGNIPMPPLEKPTKSESVKREQLKDQGIPADKDMYSLRS